MEDELMSRGDFLRLSALVTAGLLTGSWLDACFRHAEAQALSIPDAAVLPVAGGLLAKSRIAMVRSRRMTDGDLLNAAVVGTMLDAAMVHVTANPDPVACWESIAGPDDVVAIKVNMQSAPRFYTDPVVTFAVVDRLLAVGVVPENIVIYDRVTGGLRGGGYPIRTTGQGVRCYGTNGDYVGPFTYGAFIGRISRIVAEKATVLINMPLIKHHANASVTLSMKNHFGTIEFPSDHHANHSDPDIAHINMLPQIRPKQRLVVCDGSFGCYQGGPYCDYPNQWRYNRMIVSRDRVAVDTLGWQILDGYRTSKGLAKVRPPGYIATAAALGLGTNNLARMILLNQEI